MSASPFTEFLAEIIGLLPNSLGAIIQDWEGETIEYFGHLKADELRINAAQWGLLWRMIKYQAKHPYLKSSREIIIETDRQKIIIHTLFDRYYLVILLRKSASLSEARRVIGDMSARIVKEMGF
ncbi:MAG: hypothetical protein PF689_10860 [Deltaproteobacteria bacterium]|nr:hypothetical protein [Deltaproteobacteria bacterium]